MKFLSAIYFALLVVVLSACAPSQEIVKVIPPTPGTPGAPGTPGTNGSCHTDQTEGGALITCNDGSFSFIAHGTSGTNGEDGSDCSTESTEYGAVIWCTNGSYSYVYNGINGEDGADGAPGTPGLPGAPGSGTTITTGTGTCTLITGSYYLKGNTLYQEDDSNLCDSPHDKVSLNSSGDSKWLSATKLLIYDGTTVRIINFN